jgi:hypothetical protein
MPEITVFAKSGPFTKKLELDGDTIKSDNSVCSMARGTARRTAIAGVRELGALIGALPSNQALALGSLRHGLPAEVAVVTKRQLNGGAREGVIARTAESLVFHPGQSGFTLLDFDTKGIPTEVAARVDKAGGLWRALRVVVPELDAIGHVTRASTSAGLYRTDTNMPVPGSNGVHDYVAVADVADSARFLKALHDRCWLAGLGWLMVSESGALLERSIVDRVVGRPEGLVFEGAPILVPPLAQDAQARMPRIADGDWLDTAATCPELTAVGLSQLRILRLRAAHALGRERRRAEEAFVAREAASLATRTGMSRRAAERVIRRQCEGVLQSSVILPFDDPTLDGTTVGDVLADPAAYEGEPLADPLAGVDYGRGKAMVLRRGDGTPWINSFAHHGMVYALKHDAMTVRARLEQAPRGDTVIVLTGMIADADVTPTEEEALIRQANAVCGAGIRSITKEVKAAHQERRAREKEEKTEMGATQRQDPRPELLRPQPDATSVPVMATFKEVMGAVTDRVPPARNLDGVLAYVRKITIPGTRDADNPHRAPPPQLAICAMSATEAEELIERYIDFIDADGRLVRCRAIDVAHFLQRNDGDLPTIAAVATLPLVAEDGALIYTDGLDRRRGIVFEVDPDLIETLPAREDCDALAVGAAMTFLQDEWLADVGDPTVGATTDSAADPACRCTLIALALTLIERSLLDQRPTWWVTAGQRGSGKTTAIAMVVQAVTGECAAASAWSSQEDERRKALLAYLMSGRPYIMWDNIPRGAQIACQYIEASCTSQSYADRVLGVSEMAHVSAATVHIFTGNNVAPRGDLASRSLTVRLDVERSDPENRRFKHPDPIGWTQINRDRVLRALYTILLVARVTRTEGTVSSA